MKKITFIKRWAFLFFLFFAISSQYAQKSERQYPLGKTSQFLSEIQSQLMNKNSNCSKSQMTLYTSDKNYLKAIINFERKQTDGTLYLEGEILENPNGNFNISINDKKLEGKIIIPEAKKSYVYHSDSNGNAFIKEVEINTVICAGFIQPSITQTEQKLKSKQKKVVNNNISQLQSLPNAKGCLLLDFDGYYLPAGSGWNGGNPIIAEPSGMTESDILEAWEIVAEDFRPFNLNVTTDEAVFNTYPQNRRRRCVVTPTNTASPGNGGFALINNFSSFSDLPCWAFSPSSWNTGKIIGEIASHELGHTLGLNHDGQTQFAYYSGHGNWAPIMGLGYYKNVTQWSKAEYLNGTNHEDDLAIITNQTNGVGYRTDNHGNAFNTSIPLIISGQNISALQNNGVIDYTDDIDMFRFTTTGGTVNLSIQTSERHSNLLLKVLLYDSNNILLNSYIGNPLNLSESVNINSILSEGEYYLAITGTGEGTPDTGYTNYASLGFYSISGTIPNESSKINKAEKIDIYPNPVKDEITINTNSQKKFEVEIVNDLGQKIYQNIITNKILKINFSDKPRGNYFIILKNSKTGTQKSFNIIKE